MYGFLIGLHATVSVLLVIVILLQASRGGGLAGTFGGGMSTAVFGGRGAGGFLSKVTIGLATMFMALAILISLVSVPSGEGESIIKQRAAETQAPAGATLPETSLPPAETPQ